jgi:ribosomal protein S18 acetylase RimI-like enzyme
MIHLVGKKQLTYKISPLIVNPEKQGKYGIGSRLLEYAEEYIKSKKAIRQIYCTVASSNNNAINFFQKKGFIIAGDSESHYKNGVRPCLKNK